MSNKLRSSSGNLMCSKLAVKKGKKAYPILMDEIRKARDCDKPINITINVQSAEGMSKAAAAVEPKKKNPVPPQLVPFVKKKGEQISSDDGDDDDDDSGDDSGVSFGDLFNND